MVMKAHERRSGERISLTLPISGSCSEGWKGTHRFLGETRDVSSRGFCARIKGRNSYATGQNLRFGTRLYPGDFLIKGHGKICWIQALKEPEPATLMGVALTKMRHFSLWQERIEATLCGASLL